MDVLTPGQNFIPDTDYITPLNMMTDDYNSSREGTVGPGNLAPHSPEELADLRRSLAAFSVLNGVDLSIPASQIDSSVDQLLDDLTKDEVYSNLANEYRTRALQPAIESIDPKTARRVDLPTVTASELEKVLVRLGFSVDNQDGTSHAKFRHRDPENNSTFPVPVGHKGDLGPTLLRAILKQAGLSREEFVRAYKKR